MLFLLLIVFIGGVVAGFKLSSLFNGSKKIEASDSSENTETTVPKKNLHDVFSSPLMENASARVRDGLKSAWIFTAGASQDVSGWIAQTDLVSKLNTYSSELSKAMDHGFITKSFNLQDIAMTPSNHRILDGGHTISESISRAFQVGKAQGLSDTECFVEWGKAYITDLSSPAGMPVFGDLTDNIYAMLRQLGVSDATARDLVTVNGQEAIEALIGGTLSVISLTLAWKSEDKETFSRAVASVGLGSLIAMNPLMACIALVALAMGYNKTMITRDGMIRGGLVSGVGVGVSMLIPGPLLLGAIPAMVAAYYINKKLDRNISPVEQIKTLIIYLRSEEFTSKAQSKFEKQWAQFNTAA